MWDRTRAPNITMSMYIKKSDYNPHTEVCSRFHYRTAQRKRTSKNRV